MVELSEEEEKIERGAIYESTYTMREIGGGFSISVPKKVVERKAREFGVSVKKFKEDYCVVAMYDNFQNIDVGYKFVKKNDNGEK